MNDGFGEPGGVVLDADHLLGFAEFDAADTIDFADFGDGKGGGLGGGRSVAVQDIKLGHALMIAAEGEYVESKAWGFLWLRVRFPG